MYIKMDDPRDFKTWLQVAKVIVYENCGTYIL